MNSARASAIVSWAAILGLFVGACATPAGPASTPSQPGTPPAAVKSSSTPTTEATMSTTTASQPTAPAPTPKPAAEQPRYGGVLKLPVAGHSRTIDTFQEKSGLQIVPIGPTQNGLLTYSPQDGNKIIPELAERWEISPDGKTYTFNLRKGVKFHNGSPLTLEDIKFSVEWQSRKQEGLQIERLTDWAPLEKVTVEGAGTVRLHLKNVSSSFMSHIAEAHAVIAPKDVLTKGPRAFETSVIGTGPFKLKAFERGVKYELVKNASYFVEGRPYLDVITVFVVPDRGTRLAAFRTGQLHVTAVGTGYLSVDELLEVQRNHPEVVRLPSFDVTNPGFSPNWTRKPWSDVRVRRAVHLALDRQEAAKVLEKGTAEPAGFFTFSTPGIMSKEELLKQPGYRQPKDADIAEAKRLLAEAGYPDGFEIALTARGDADAVKWGELMLAQLKRNLGISGKMNPVTKAISDELRLKESFDAMSIQTVEHMSNPVFQARWYVGKGLSNVSRNDDAKIAELFAALDRELDPVKSADIARQLEQRMFEVLPRIPLYWSSEITVKWPHVRNLEYIGYYLNVRHADVWLAK